MRIVRYDPVRPDHRAAFRDLNLAWIERWFAVEATDRHQLDDPEGNILAEGGMIFMAEEATPEGIDVVGTCALLARPDGARKLAKMAVKESAKGKGIGRALGEAAIAAARAAGAPRVELMSNTVLEPAIALYRRLGFVEVPMRGSEFARANVAMELRLTTTASSG